MCESRLIREDPSRDPYEEAIHVPPRVPSACKDTPRNVLVLLASGIRLVHMKRVLRIPNHKSQIGTTGVPSDSQ